MRRFLKKLPTIILWLMLVSAIFILLITFTNLNNILMQPLLRDETPSQADAIIVLGGGIDQDLRELPQGVKERLNQGVELYKDGYASKIIVTGGLVKDQNYRESEFMIPYLVRLGVEEDDIFEENRALDTYENSVYSREIMEEQNWQTALLVTSDYHTQRACHVFEKQDFNIRCIAAFKDIKWKDCYSRNIDDFRAIVRDYLATVYYFVKGYI